MSFNTIAELLSDTLQGLSFPASEICPVEDVYAAVVRSLAYYKVVQTQSNQNLAVKHKDFTPNGRDVKLTFAPDVNTPLWLENLTGAAPFEVYGFVPACNLNMLEESRARGERRWAYYTENGVGHVRLSYDPQFLMYRQHRLWYDPAMGIGQSLESPTLMPPDFYPLPVARAQTILIPQMVARAAGLGLEVSELQMTAWKLLLASATKQEEDWKLRHRHFVFEGRGSERGRRRRSVLSSGRSFSGYRGT